MRIRRDAFLYLDGTDRNFAQCETCYDFAKQWGCCARMGYDVAVDGDDTCGAYLKGTYQDQPIVKLATPKELGFLKDENVRCENCKYGGADCALYGELNETLPDMFDLDTKIKPRGCCNAWTPK